LLVTFETFEPIDVEAVAGVQVEHVCSWLFVRHRVEVIKPGFDLGGLGLDIRRGTSRTIGTAGRDQ
jgi:hypothetical protein